MQIRMKKFVRSHNGEYVKGFEGGLSLPFLYG